MLIFLERLGLHAFARKHPTLDVASNSPNKMEKKKKSRLTEARAIDISKLENEIE